MNHTRCEDKVLGQQTSTDGKIVAVTYARSCANNTGLYTWVGLRDTSSHDPANVEVEAVLTIRGMHHIPLVWHNPSSLEIQLPTLDHVSEILTKKESWRTVTISYKN